jgi:MoaA/NifB/PqqE/SkfB family radical SAM enzyme
MPPFGESELPRVKGRALQSAIPLVAHLELTYCCSWRCVFCYNRRRNDESPLAVGEWDGVLDDLRTLGTLVVTITGGEPLAHPHFFEIAASARRRAFALRIFTNGSLVSDDAAERIAELRPLAVELSLHGASAAVHDLATATPGSFEAVWVAVDRLRARGVPIVLKSIVTRLNESELNALIALASRRSTPLRLNAALSPRDDGSLGPLRMSASPAGIDRMMASLAAVGRVPTVPERVPGGANCGLGRLTLTIDPEGNVYPCMQWRSSALGNVRDTRLARLWHESDRRREAAMVAVAANDAMYQLRGAAARYPFCPALAKQRTGNPLTPPSDFFGLAAAAEHARLAARSERVSRATADVRLLEERALDQPGDGSRQRPAGDVRAFGEAQAGEVDS